MAKETDGLSVTWWKNDGRGGFVRAGEWLAPINNRCVDIADYTGDGLPDLLIYDPAYPVNGMALCVGHGIAGFDGPVKIPGLPPTFSLPSWPMTHDVNHDGLPDLLFSDGVWFNRGGGVFVAGANHQVIFNPYWAFSNGFWADANGDGLDDFYFVQGDSIQLSIQKSDGSFGGSETIYPHAPGWSTLHAESILLPAVSDQPCIVLMEMSPDPERDLYLQLVVPGGAASPLGKVELAKGSDLRNLPTFTAVADGSRTRLIVSLPAEFKGRETTEFHRSSQLEAVVAMRGGKPALTLKTLTKVADGVSAPLFADLNGDGASDLLFPQLDNFGVNAELAWLPAKANGTFATAIQPITERDASEVPEFAGDLTGDGAVDLLTANNGVSSITLWQNSGHGESFTPQVIYTRGFEAHVVGVRGTGADAAIYVHSVASADADVTRNELVRLTRMKGGKFRQETVAAETGRPWVQAKLIDGNGDGLDDLQIETLDSATQAPHWHWLGQIRNSGRFAILSKKQAMDFPAADEQVVDVDWDGDLDRWGPAGWREKNAAGVWIPHPPPSGSVTIPGGSVSLSSALPAGLDFDGDGHEDYFLDGSIPVLANGYGHPDNTLYPFRLPLVTSPTAGWFQGGTPYLDVDGDGDLDILTGALPSNPFQGALNWTMNAGGLSDEEEPEIAPPLNSTRDRFLMADLDGDGVADLVVGSSWSHGRLEWFKVSNP